MKDLSKILLEKLRINKDLNIKNYIYLVLYSYKGEPLVKRYEDKDDAKKDSSNEDYDYYLGYKIPIELEDELTKLFIDAYNGKIKAEVVDKYAEKNKLVKIWETEN